MILQRTIPYDPTVRPRLPGVQPLKAPWLIVDDAYAAQMAERDRLIEAERAAVIGHCAGAGPAVRETLDAVLAALPEGFVRGERGVRRPDGMDIPVDRDDPLATMGRLVQEDICILEKPAEGAEHVLTAAVLCFPARWRLSEKLGRPLTAIHDPVPEYDVGLAPRVQRLFDGVGVDRPLWRCNELWTADPRLFQPDPPTTRPKWTQEAAEYLRSERQCIVRLPQTRAVLFTIHTYMVAQTDLSGLSARPD